MELAERFMAKVEVRDSRECWPWTGYVAPHGYGSFAYGGRNPNGWPNVVPAHRISYELHVGPIPEGLEIDHLCRNRRCVNPSHLEPVTGKENMRRAFDTHCRNGHARTVANTYVTPSTGYRSCRDCRKERGW